MFHTIVFISLPPKQKFTSHNLFLRVEVVVNLEQLFPKHQIHQPPPEKKYQILF